MEDIPVYLAHMALDEPRKAWESLVAANPLPAVTGRVCPHPCESSCNRGLYDSAVSIHSVERFLGDMALKEGWPYPVGSPEKKETPVAVVGGGPAGLSCAYHLLLMGYPVTLFEAQPEAGGICRQAIPDYRLPAETVAGEVSRILDLGIDFRPRTKLGRDLSLRDLEEGFSAVFLAPGRQAGREWSVARASPDILLNGLDLLKELKNIGSLPNWPRVVIVGGGNTGVDLARTLKRAGSREVHIVTDEDLPSQARDNAPAAMPAIPREIAMAQDEGIVFHPRRTVHRLLIREGKVQGVEIVHALKEVSNSPPLHRTFSGTETILEADQVIPAVGQVVSPEGLERLLSAGRFIPAGPGDLVTGTSRIFAGGDACHGGGSVAHAVGSGHRAALGIDTLIRNREGGAPPEAPPIPYSGLNLRYFDHSASLSPHELPVTKRAGFDEIDLPHSRGEIVREAARCLSCGHCMECDNCWTLCPDNAVLKTGATGPERLPYVFDYDYCKGCGLCAKECPSGHIRMVPEP
jgi:2-oxoacid:acceptor oxidoreductase delta subunit (pyruvate/2-ketoisovalerate family)